MLKKLFERITGGKPETQAPDQEAAFRQLNQSAPLTQGVPTQVGTTPPAPPPQGNTATFLCRETILGRDQRIAGYQFLLHEGTRNRIRLSNRRIHHIYAEVMVRSLARSEIGKLLGHRLAFIELPDSFVEHPAIEDLQASNSVLMLTHLPLDDALPLERIVERAAALRLKGFRIAITEPALAGVHAALAKQADFIVLQAERMAPERVRDIALGLKQRAPGSAMLVRGLPSQEDFQLCYDLGAKLFQGPFVTRRENWRGNKLGPNAARLADLLNRLRREADTRELAELLKTDPALSVRMLHYMNSPAIGLPRKISSIEQALVMLGRDRLQRWVLLLLYSSQSNSPRSAALLENALVRARMMELMGKERPGGERDALYLVGLLSLIDLILEVPMDKALESLAPAPEIVSALLQNEGWLAQYLELAITAESLDAHRMEELAEQCGISAGEVSSRHIEALAWAMEVNQ